MRLLKKITYYSFIVVLAVGASGLLGAYIYKDEIIDLLTEEVNKSLKTKLEVENIDLNLFKGFPNIAVDFTGVRFHSAFQNEMLLTGERIFFVLNVLDLLEKNVVIERLEVINGKLVLHTNKKGEHNYNVFVRSDTTTNAMGTLDIHSIKFSNVTLVHKDVPQNIDVTYKIDKLSGSAQIENKGTEFYVQSVLSIEDTETKGLNWAVGKELTITTRLFYSDKLLSISPSELQINKVHLNFNGEIDLIKPSVLIELSGKQNNFLSLVSILPLKYQNRLAPFNGKGLIDFSSRIKGPIKETTWPQITASIHLTDFEINHKKLKEILYLKNVDGNLEIKDLKNLETGKFTLTHMGANVKNKDLTINGAINNFENPELNGTVNGDLDLPWLFSITNIPLAEPANGYVTIHAALEAKQLENHNTRGVDIQKVSATLDLNNVRFHLINSLSVSELNGQVKWEGSQTKIHNLKGKYGSSDLMLNGNIEHLGYLIGSPESKEVKAVLNIESTHLNLDEIVDFATHLSTDSTATKQQKALQNLFDFDVALSVDTINFRRFKGTDLHASLKVEPRRITVEKATSGGMGGKMAIIGSISRQYNDDYFIEANVDTKNIELDSLFYVFDNFQQTFITADYLKGKLNSNIYTYMYFDKDWRFRRNLLYSKAILQIRKGELNNFEPIMALSPYLNNEEEKLSRLKFSDLNSHIDIANDTVFLSDMYVGSNVRNIKIGGYHTLDQHLDYRLSVPVVNDRKDKDLEFGEVKTDKEGRLYWPFRIKGTTEDYKVSYDLGRAGSNIVKGIKREISEFGNVLKGNKKEIKNDTLLLEDDEYFDWDNE